MFQSPTDRWRLTRTQRQHFKVSGKWSHNQNELSFIVSIRSSTLMRHNDEELLANISYHALFSPRLDVKPTTFLHSSRSCSLPIELMLMLMCSLQCRLENWPESGPWFSSGENHCRGPWESFNPGTNIPCCRYPSVNHSKGPLWTNYITSTATTC